MTTTPQFPVTSVHGSHLDGQVLYPGTRGYDLARSVWNGMIDHRPNEHPDLFWGLRGGGGNFGIVVEFEFRLHPRH